MATHREVSSESQTARWRSPPNQLCFGAILDLQTKLHVWWRVSRIHPRLCGMKGGEGPNPAPGVTGCHRGFCSVPLLLVHHFFHLPGGGVFKKTVPGEAADGASDPTVQLTFENPPLVESGRGIRKEAQAHLRSPPSDPPSPQRPRLHGQWDDAE